MAQGPLARKDGRPVVLGAVLGRGGEGTVHEVAHQPQLVAKLYATRPTPERVDKLMAMVALAEPALTRIAAWPVDAIVERGPHGGAGAVVGFLMPKVAEHKELHKLAHPMDRFKHFPDVGFDFLVHVATNMARAFQVVHERGLVVGDVNESGIMVGRDGTVKLIDCDSMQFEHGGRLFGCDVGKPELQPPEMLAHASFRGVVRTVAHDAFGLSVLIFQLLFFGWHPFAVKMRVGEQKTPAENIREGRFPYVLGFRSSEYARPPHALEPGVFPDYIRDLFERAFMRERTRPAASEWVAGLMRFAGETRACPRFGTHAFHASLDRCPLCELDTRLGFAILPHIALDAAQLRGLWGAIQKAFYALSAPLEPPELAVPEAAEAALVEPEVVAFARRRVAATYAQCAVAGVGAALGVVMGSAWWALVGVAVVLELVMWLARPASVKRIRRDHRLRSRIFERARAELTAAPASAIVQNFEAASAAYDRIIHHEGVRQAALTRLQDRFFPTQLRRFLASHPLRVGALPGLGPRNVAALGAAGVRSAADLVGGVPRVRGMDEGLVEVLGRWVEFLSTQFMPDLRDPAYLAEVGRLDARLDAEHAQRVESLKLTREWMADELPKDGARREALLERYRAAGEALIEEAPRWAVASARFRVPR